MKKVKLQLEVIHPDNKTTEYVYSDYWMENKHRIPAVLYQSNRIEEYTLEGKTYQTAYAIVPDDFKEGEPANDIDMSIFALRHRPRVEKIDDPNKVLLILAKKARGLELGPEDLNALDPQSSVSGIVYSKTWDDICKEYGA